MADAYIVLSHTREKGGITIGEELPSRISDSKKIFFPVREIGFYGSKVLFREGDSDAGKEIIVFGFKQSMPHESGRDYRQDYLGYEDIDVNYIFEEKTQREIVEKIRGSIPLTEMKKYAEYKSFGVKFAGDKESFYSLIKHRDFGRLSK